MSIFTYREIKGNRGRIRVRWGYVASVVILTLVAILGLYSAFTYPDRIREAITLAIPW